jgi:hypothetical protein
MIFLMKNITTLKSINNKENVNLVFILKITSLS